VWRRRSGGPTAGRKSCSFILAAKVLQRTAGPLDWWGRILMLVQYTVFFYSLRTEIAAQISRPRRTRNTMRERERTEKPRSQDAYPGPGYRVHPARPSRRGPPLIFAGQGGFRNRHPPRKPRLACGGGAGRRGPSCKRGAPHNACAT
jgi:hypothetical protein